MEQVAGALASARARLRLARADRARSRALFREGVTSREELDRRESEADVAQATVEELEANLQRVRIDLEDTVIRAPTDGVVLETFKQPGEVAVPGGFSGSGDLLRLANLAEIRAELDVNESDLQRVALGQAARIVPDAFPDVHYAGRVVRLSPQIDRQKGTREVEVRVVDPDERLLPDMSVRVDFLDALPAPDAPDDAVVLPRAALQHDAGGAAYVWVVEDGRARRREVDVSDTLGDRVVVAAGLPEGTRVVVGAEPAEDGARVAPDAP